jgi:hypothetical protein
MMAYCIRFRSLFPYYYDNCEHCGNAKTNEFYGFIFPNNQERIYKSGISTVCIVMKETITFECGSVSDE